MAVQRVSKRVSEGGHNIPEETIRRRYVSGIKNLFSIYSNIVDRWILVDNNTSHSVIFAESENGVNKIYDFEKYKHLMKYNHDGE